MGDSTSHSVFVIHLNSLDYAHCLNGYSIQAIPFRNSFLRYTITARFPLNHYYSFVYYLNVAISIIRVSSSNAVAVNTNKNLSVVRYLHLLRWNENLSQIVSLFIH